MIKPTHPLTRVPLNISLVIPAYNNALTLKSQLEACEKIMETLCQTYEIIVSNDASSDKTAALLKKYFENDKHFTIINQKVHIGIARNSKLLYNAAHYDYILPFSIDGVWDTSDIARLAHTAYEKKADMVIGKRKKKTYSLFRQVISVLYNGLILLLFQVKIQDTGSIKIFKKQLLTTIQPISTSTFFDGEFIIRAKMKGFSIKTISINYYPTNKQVTDRINLGIIFSSLRDILLLRLIKI